MCTVDISQLCSIHTNVGAELGNLPATRFPCNSALRTSPRASVAAARRRRQLSRRPSW